VKNVNFIEVGRYRMETWYFSPLPKEYWKDGVAESVRERKSLLALLVASVFLSTARCFEFRSSSVSSVSRSSRGNLSSFTT
jgi:hypothetical protein